MVSAAIEASFMDRPRPATAPATSSAEDSKTMSWPAPNPGGSSRLPCLPPIALAQPPPPTAVVTHGIQALADTIAAKSATSQPGCSRRIMVATLADFDVALSDRLSPKRRQVEDDARRIGGRSQPPVRGVLSRPHHSAAVAADHLQRLVDVLGTEEDAPM